MSKLISNKMSKDFVNGLTNGLLTIGAKIIESKNDCMKEFELDTVVGKLNISIPVEQSTVFSVFSRFENVERAKEKFDCNPHSGKYNVYIGIVPEMTAEIAVNIVLSIFKCTTQEKCYSTTKPN